MLSSEHEDRYEKMTVCEVIFTWRLLMRGGGYLDKADWTTLPNRNKFIANECAHFYLQFLYNIGFKDKHAIKTILDIISSHLCGYL